MRLPLLSEKIFRIFKQAGLSGIIIRLGNKLKIKSNYETWWIEKHAPTQEYLVASKEISLNFNYKPLISVILPVHNTPDDFLHDCVLSILAQTYSNFELCIADDCSGKTNVRSLVQEYAKQDNRIKYVFLDNHTHIAGTTNAAIGLANGDYLAFIDHDDTLTPNALFEVVSCLQENPDTDVIYSNEDKIDLAGNRSEPCMKPILDIEYFLSFMYIGHLSVYRKSIVTQLGGLTLGTEGAQDYDLALRVLEKTNKVLHIPKILYHWRKHADSVALNVNAKPYAYEAMKRVLTEGLKRRSIEGSAWLEETNAVNVNRPRYEVNTKRKVLVLMYQDSGKYSRSVHKLESEKHQIITSYCMGKNTISLNSDYISHAKTFSDFFTESLEKFSDVDFIVNIDTELEVNPDVVDQLVEQALRPEIAIVSAKIERKYPYSCMQGGYTLCYGKLKNNFYGATDPHQGYGGRLLTQRSASVVSSNLTLYKIDFLKKINLNNLAFKHRECFDVGICLAIREKQGTILWTPFIKGILSSNSTYQSEYILRDYTDDFKLLDDQFNVSNFVDPFYPRGLDTKKLDFTLET